MSKILKQQGIALGDRVCKIHPLYSECRNCLEIQMEGEFVSDCTKCLRNTEEYELLGVGSGFFGAYAMVQKDGKIEKVSLSRVHDIRHKDK